MNKNGSARLLDSNHFFVFDIYLFQTVKFGIIMSSETIENTFKNKWKEKKGMKELDNEKKN